MAATAHVADDHLVIKVIAEATTRLTLTAIIVLRETEIQRGQQVHGFLGRILARTALTPASLGRIGLVLAFDLDLGFVLGLGFDLGFRLLGCLRLGGLRDTGLRCRALRGTGLGLRRLHGHTGGRLATGTGGLKRGKQLRLAHGGGAAQSHLLGKLLEFRQFHAFKILAIGHVIYLSTAFAKHWALTI